MKRHFEDVQLGSIELVLGGVPLARHGARLFQTYKFIVEQELADGSLVEVLQPYGGRSRPFTLLYHHGRYVPHRMRAFVGFLMQCRDEWGTSWRKACPVLSDVLRGFSACQAGVDVVDHRGQVDNRVDQVMRA